ncbi:tRNA (adenosine(37)-N6)-threonylcarbamoyltransferase complex ATPase subunit type 1 TsaE [Hyphobacterium marinum]|uniref:tRNA threonylcarbamoyladenosine biosynthesis protein TsaE n=1 Tax=Hyphobacterium marinum TaxID=3116574 RepID=A0ABU7LUG0_9PROT|nr:tRNA (adenosine(37)-N6)-threonylcarbamoyltransferase complex ATPase subunit type 1 TsaE [Hyphobacterium sp. Y6023]MEE2565203.1 tRNA (adenosine(37)-N6)-threonylcarbamoyltransferase complex ATPase subunit type 1 TsaE [Hyphobacterium sp. Y6023]
MTPRTLTSVSLTDPDATLALGAALADCLEAGDTVFLIGDLGAGKTTLARGLIASACGIDDVPSPTYTLVQSYETKDGTPLLHADLYRIDDEADLDELGLEDAFADCIVLVEWPDRLGRRAPERRLDIVMTAGDAPREARIIAHGDWEDRLERLDADI